MAMSQTCQLSVISNSISHIRHSRQAKPSAKPASQFGVINSDQRIKSLSNDIFLFHVLQNDSIIMFSFLQNDSESGSFPSLTHST
jgi:hypothetical protein